MPIIIDLKFCHLGTYTCVSPLNFQMYLRGWERTKLPLPQRELPDELNASSPRSTQRHARMGA